MGAKINRREQVEYLKERGFEPVRHADGSHEMWEHPEFQALAATYKLEIPLNLTKLTKTTSAAVTSRVVLPDSAGYGTWNSIAKLADWCHEQVETLKQKSEQAQKTGATAREFREDANEFSDQPWKKYQQQRQNYPNKPKFERKP